MLRITNRKVANGSDICERIKPIVLGENKEDEVRYYQDKILAACCSNTDLLKRQCDNHYMVTFPALFPAVNISIAVYCFNGTSQHSLSVCRVLKIRKSKYR